MAATADIQNNNSIEVRSMDDNLNSVNNVTNSRSPPNSIDAANLNSISNTTTSRSPPNSTDTMNTGHIFGGSGLPRVLLHLDNEEPSSLGSMIYDDEYHEDPLLDLTLGNLGGDNSTLGNYDDDYADPSMDYVFVSSIFSSPCLDNSEALLKQLQDMGVRVNEDYLNLDLDLTVSRSCSVSSGPESLEEENDSLTIVSLDPPSHKLTSLNHKRVSSSRKKHPIFSVNSLDDSDSLAHTDSFEDEFAEAEILPNGGGVKVTYENYKKEYRSRVSPMKNYVKYLELTPEEEEAPEKSFSSYDKITNTLNEHNGKERKDPLIQNPSNTLDDRYRRAVAAFSKRMSMKLEGMSDELSGFQSKCSLKLKKLLAEEITYDTVTPDSGVHETFNALSPEEQEKQREEWKSELVKTEEEIQTLRQVLNSKVKHAQDLKRRLGITVWREFTDDFNASMKSVRESQ
ncbi:unnamed protein product, partial [Meganyctiphanes norvegica]